MPKSYSRQFHKMVIELICVQKEETIRTAENRVIAYNKDPHCFDDNWKQ